MLDLKDSRIGIIGLGYVGLPLAVAFGRKFPTLGFDIDANRVAELKAGKDGTLEVSAADLAAVDQLTYSASADDLAGCNTFVVTVPTPIDRHKRPDLRPLESASRTVGEALGKGDVVIFESTVYPGATEEVCVPILERIS
ncbi:MAG: Vi polysaccharide biosynthesis UDP-N-acetylglucosamine C-6 dehydrogenase TviB, partial [Chromatiales bacterium]|nr:Vi polysaccharide biosynthesis UDP-N-acetylglucosamine C-6 dehydrogenase TviB [Chromatiales bacterium]